MINILIYCGIGTNHQSAKAIGAEMAEVLGDGARFGFVDGAYLRDQDWENGTQALVMGGGVCSEWESELTDVGMLKIHHFVMNGGFYLGVCAGAYFGAAASLFSATSTEIICKNRPLKFYPGWATGPFCYGSDYLSPQAALALKIELVYQQTHQEGFCYYQGGCSFDIEESTSTTKVLAMYASPLKQAAVISCIAGRGKAVLCGFHPEFFWEKQANSTPEIRELSEQLSIQEGFRKMLWHEMVVALFTPS